MGLFMCATARSLFMYCTVRCTVSADFGQESWLIDGRADGVDGTDGWSVENWLKIESNNLNQFDGSFTTIELPLTVIIRGSG